MIEGPYDESRVYQLDYPEDTDYTLERVDEVDLLDSEIVHTVLEGETLHSISYKYYGNSSRWSDIADYNGLVNPFELKAGNNLIIPM